MPKYTNEAGSQFPAHVYEPTGFLDATTSLATAINTIRQFQSVGNFRAAADYIENYAGVDLKKYLIDAAVINKIDEETRNLEIYAKNNQQQIFYEDDDPEFMMSIGDIWIGNQE